MICIIEMFYFFLSSFDRVHSHLKTLTIFVRHIFVILIYVLHFCYTFFNAIRL